MTPVRFSRHARGRMRDRRISAAEVEEVLAGPVLETPGWNPGVVNRWGSTRSGRWLRITLALDEDLVVTVVAPDEGH